MELGLGNLNVCDTCLHRRLPKLAVSFPCSAISLESTLFLHRGYPSGRNALHFLQLQLLVIYAFEKGVDILPDNEQDVLLAPNVATTCAVLSSARPAPALQKIIIPSDEEFPLLDSLAFISESDGDSARSHSPNHSELQVFATEDLNNHSSTMSPFRQKFRYLQIAFTSSYSHSKALFYSPLEYLLDLSVCPSLDTVSWISPTHPGRDAGTLRRQKQFQFICVNTYLEGILTRISSPVLGPF